MLEEAPLPPRMGWERTFLLAAVAGAFAFIGVIAGAYALHIARQQGLVS